MRRCSVWLALLSLLAVGQRAHAQELTQDRAPRFLLASGAKLVPVDVSRTAVLGRRLSLDLAGATLKEALVTIAAQSGLELYYSDDLVPLERRVHLQAAAITVAAALTDVLFDTGVDVVFRPNGRAALVRRGTLPQGGTVTGRVTDARTERGVAGVRVFLERTRWGTTTDSAGIYRLTEVAPGAYTLVARRIGYRAFSQPVTVEADREATVDVTLQPAPSELEAVVVTATGEQRLLELGHVVGRINADSVVKAAPISTLSELLTGRVSGLQVFQAAGTVGGEVHTQIRGANSLFLSTEPIVIVDGVRYTSSVAERQSITGAIKGETTSPLNDLNPNDIESVEVVKGPSAATLYGTDAANGVLVITTKRGRPGPARWNFHVIGSQTEIAKGRFPVMYAGYGRLTSNNQPTDNCRLLFVSFNICVQDSVGVFLNPLEDPDLTLFKSEPRWETGASVAGGLGDLRYYFSANYEDATGPIRMPKAIAEELREVRGELPEEVLRPNTLNKLNLRANMAALLGQTLDLRVNTSYTRNTTRAVSAGSTNPYVKSVSSSPDDPYGNQAGGPEGRFSRRSTEFTDRFIGNASAQWRPVPWLLARAQMGLDLSQRNHYGLVRRGEHPDNAFFNNGVVQDDRVRQLSMTADGGVTATGRLGRLSARTAVGAQYVRRLDDGLFSLGRDMPPGATSVGEGAIRDARQSYGETVTLGTFIDETIGLNDRLFVTGALRVDGASTFGRDYDATIYPKASVSWLLSEEPFFPRVRGLGELRLRYAFGASGQQPLPAWARPGFRATAAYVDGAEINVIAVNGLGNPDLRPEQVSEHEFGFDVAGLANRLQAGLTWYSRQTTDQIVLMPLAPGLGSIFTNLGLTTQNGFEADVTAQVVETRLVSWNLRYQYGSNRTELVDLGGAAERRRVSGSLVEGYSLGARFFPRIIGYEDVNGDGILTFNEVQRTDTAVYVGEGIPPRMQSLTTTLGLFDRRLRISALLERRSGFVQIDFLKWLQCGNNGRCRAAVDPTTPLAEQAEVAVGALPFQPGDFTRLREVTLAVDIPARLARAIGAQSGTLSIAGRNLALWSGFDGADPEVGSVEGIRFGEANGIPLGRTWTVRFDLGY